MNSRDFETRSDVAGIVHRPTLIVGVGGTGSRAVKETKERIERIYQRKSGRSEGNVPFIRYLVFDTLEEETDWLPILGASDFKNLNSNPKIRIMQVVEAIRKQHIGFRHYNWFRKDMPPPDLDLGANGVRPLGRLCYFEKRNTIQVKGAIEEKYIEITKESVRYEAATYGFNVSMGGGIDVHLISSISGGTGAGIFLDLAYDLRLWASEPISLTAHLVLPEAFKNHLDEETYTYHKAKGYQLLKELNHFHINGGWSVEHRDGVVDHLSSATPFQHCFLISTNRATDNIDLDEIPKIVGEAITTFVMTPTGRAQYALAVNVKPALIAYDEQGQRRSYSSYGICTGVIPHEEIQRRGAEGLYQYFLDELLRQDSSFNAREEFNRFYNDLSLDLARRRTPDFSTELRRIVIEETASIRSMSGRRDRERWERAANNAVSILRNEVRGMQSLLESDVRENIKRIQAEVNNKVLELIDSGHSLPDIVGKFLDSLKRRLEEADSNLQDPEANSHNVSQAIQRVTDAVASGDRLLLEEALLREAEEQGNRLTEERYNGQVEIYRTALGAVDRVSRRYSAILDNLAFLRERHSQEGSLPVMSNSVERKPICSLEDVLDYVRRQTRVSNGEIFASLGDDTLVGKDTRDLEEAIMEACRNSIANFQDVTCTKFLTATLRNRNRAHKTKVNLKNLLESASPLWKVGLYPAEKIVESLTIGIRHPNAEDESAFIEDVLNRLEDRANNFTTIHDNHELPILSTSHGLALWGLGTINEYYTAFRNCWDRFIAIDKSWNLEEITPLELRQSNYMSVFARYDANGFIQKRGVEYVAAFNGGSLSGQFKWELFKKFRNNQTCVTEWQGKLEEIEQGMSSNEEIIEFYEDQLGPLQSRVDSLPAPGEVNNISVDAYYRELAQYRREREAIELYILKLQG